MIRKPVNLGPDDPTIFAKCSPCSRRGRGFTTKTIYQSAFPAWKWRKGPKCPNCNGPLTKLYEVK